MTHSDKVEACLNFSFPTVLEDVIVFYDEWATTYDKDLVGNYTAPRRSADIIARLLTNKDAQIIDMACGTGLVAQELTQRGYKNIDGVDISAESIKQSKERGLYRRLICDRIGTNKLDMQDDTYDGLIMCGALAPGHADQDCFPELIRIVKPGGIITFNTSTESIDEFERFKDGRLEASIQDLASKGLWVLESSEEFPDFAFNRPGVEYVCKVQ